MTAADIPLIPDAAALLAAALLAAYLSGPEREDLITGFIAERDEARAEVKRLEAVIVAAGADLRRMDKEARSRGMYFTESIMAGMLPAAARRLELAINNKGKVPS